MEELYTLNKKDAWKQTAVFIVALISLFAVSRVIGDEEMRAAVAGAGAYGWFIIILAKASTMIFAPLSGGLLYPLAGSLYGFWGGYALVLLGDALGGTVTFWISRIWGQKLTERMLGDDNVLLNRALELMSSVKGFLLARSLLITLPELATYCAGLSRIPFIPFLMIHMLVDLVPTALLTASGSYLVEGKPWITTAAIVTMGFLGAGATYTFMRINGFDPLDPDTLAQKHTEPQTLDTTRKYDSV